MAMPWLTQAAVNMSGDPNAKMHYSVLSYCRYVYRRYLLKLIGWPDDIIFTNLSGITGMERIMRLLTLLEAGTMRFVPVSVAEANIALYNPLHAAPAALHRGLPEKLGRNDIKKRRYRPVTNPTNRPYRRVRNGPKTPKHVEDSEA